MALYSLLYRRQVNIIKKDCLVIHSQNILLLWSTLIYNFRSEFSIYQQNVKISIETTEHQSPDFNISPPWDWWPNGTFQSESQNWASALCESLTE